MIRKIAQHWLLKLVTLSLSISIPLCLFVATIKTPSHNAINLLVLLGICSLGVMASISKVKSKGVAGALLCALASGVYAYFMPLQSSDLLILPDYIGLESLKVISVSMTTLFGVKSLIHSTLRHY